MHDAKKRKKKINAEFENGRSQPVVIRHTPMVWYQCDEWTATNWVASRRSNQTPGSA